MSWGRFIASAAAVAAVAGAAVVAVRMGGATADPHADQTPFVMPTLTSAHYPTPTSVPSTVPSTAAGRTSPVAAAPHRSVASSPRHASTTVRPAPRTTRAPAPHTTARTAPPPAAPAPRPAARTSGGRLPLPFVTGTATRVITVVAHSTGSTVATLQAWAKAPGGGWLRRGAAVTAHVGSQGLTTAPSESKSATPIGSFTLTQAFGYYGNPGTTLPYRLTTPADWWISQSGPLYNTLQRCSGSCGFRQGDPNEHLYYTRPYYAYAVVIDYNTRNSPTGVRQGAGSAFFLHVTDGRATAGCVAIPQSNLVSIMRWLAPSTHPRILIGVA